MNNVEKGYHAQEIVDQAKRLDKTHITYNIFYLTGISGSGRGKEGALESARIFNKTNPKIMGSSMLTIYPESQLYEEIQKSSWNEESELKKLIELKTLIENLAIPVFFATLGASNAVWVEGMLPRNKQKMIFKIERECIPENEIHLRQYNQYMYLIKRLLQIKLSYNIWGEL